MSDRDAKGRLADWFRQWRVPLRKFLVGKGAVPAADLEDVAQEVFLRLMRYDRTDLIEHPQAYLYKMASNVAAEWAIRWRYSRPHDPRWLSGLVATGRPEQNCARGEAEHEIQRALNAGLTRLDGEHCADAQRRRAALHTCSGFEITRQQ